MFDNSTINTSVFRIKIITIIFKTIWSKHIFQVFTICKDYYDAITFWYLSVLSYLSIQAETASDKDFHVSIATTIKSHFNRKPKPSMSSAGIRLVATTALDKDSRYFEGRKQPQLTLPADKTTPTNGFEDDDEIF